MPRWLPEAAARHPDRPAVVAPDGTLTYSELLDQAAAAAPDPYLVSRPGLDFVIGLHACLLRDVGAVPLDPRLTEAERDERRMRAGATADLAAVVFTSGTTGAPKPVRLRPANVEASAAGFAARLGRGTWLCPLPLAHVGGLMVLLRSAVWGTTAMLGPATRITRPDVAFASLVPTQLLRLLDEGLREPSVRVILGGAPPPPALLGRARDAGVSVSVTYGMTETCSMITLDGVPIDGAEIELAPDGEIIVRGPMVALGEHRTGDLGRFEEGRLQVIGRKSDTIITGAENVAPAEVEASHAAHPHIADVAVVGRSDPEWGEAVVALVVPRAGARIDLEGVREFCRGRLAPFKVPKAVETVPELPRTTSGKLLRRNL